MSCRIDVLKLTQDVCNAMHEELKWSVNLSFWRLVDLSRSKQICVLSPQHASSNHPNMRHPVTPTRVIQLPQHATSSHSNTRHPITPTCVIQYPNMRHPVTSTCIIQSLQHASSNHSNNKSLMIRTLAIIPQQKTDMTHIYRLLMSLRKKQIKTSC